MKSGWKRIRAIIVVCVCLLSSAVSLVAQDETQPEGAQLPIIMPLVDHLSMRAVRCGGPLKDLDCALASILLPDGSTRRGWAVPLENQSAVEAEIVSMAIPLTNAVVGVTTHTEVTVDGLDNLTMPANAVSYLTISVDPSQLELGTYNGTLRLRVKDWDVPLTLPVDLSVRSGPLLPLLLIIGGIMLGRVARRMETPEAQAQMALVPRLATLSQALDQITDRVVKQAFQEQINTVKAQNNDPKISETLKEKVDQLEERLKEVVYLQTWGTKLSQLPSSSQLRKEIEPEIEKGWAAWMNFEWSLDEARSISQGIREIGQKFKVPHRSGGSQSQLEKDLEKLSDTPLPGPLTDTKSTSGTGKPPAQGSTVSVFNSVIKLFSFLLTGVFRLFTRLSGFSRHASLRYYGIRPALWVVAVFFLTVVGLQNQYINANAAFGANGVYDYIGLFLWGISADVASISILRLPESIQSQQGRNA